MLKKFNQVLLMREMVDDDFIMYQYDKDRPFDEMRRDIYFDIYGVGYSYTNKELTEHYTIGKNKLKEKNKLLHELFLAKKHKIITAGLF